MYSLQNSMGVSKWELVSEQGMNKQMNEEKKKKGSKREIGKKERGRKRGIEEKY